MTPKKPKTPKKPRKSKQSMRFKKRYPKKPKKTTRPRKQRKQKKQKKQKKQQKQKKQTRKTKKHKYMFSPISRGTTPLDNITNLTKPTNPTNPTNPTYPKRNRNEGTTDQKQSQRQRLTTQRLTTQRQTTNQIYDDEFISPYDKDTVEYIYVNVFGKKKNTKHNPDILDKDTKFVFYVGKSSDIGARFSDYRDIDKGRVDKTSKKGRSINRGRRFYMMRVLCKTTEEYAGYNPYKGFKDFETQLTVKLKDKFSKLLNNSADYYQDITGGLRVFDTFQYNGPGIPLEGVAKLLSVLYSVDSVKELFTEYKKKEIDGYNLEDFPDLVIDSDLLELIMNNKEKLNMDVDMEGFNVLDLQGNPIET